MSRTDNQIWQVTTEMPTGQLHFYSSYKIGNAIRLDSENEMVQVIVPDATNPIDKHTYQETGRQIPSGILDIWIALQSLVDQGKNASRLVHERKKALPFEIWALIASFAIGDNNPDIFSPLNTIANYSLCLRDRPRTPGIFPIVFHPDVLVRAVLLGDETMVRNILKTNPDLSRIGTAIDFSGRQFTGTALKAAIATMDFAMNNDFTGICELIVEHLKCQDPDHWYSIFENQALTLYKKSLRFYVERQVAKITTLQMAKSEGLTIDENELSHAELRLQAYLAALKSNDLTTIINAHTAQDMATPSAQKDPVFQVDPALINAIETASDKDILAVLNDPTIHSPLSNLLKQFRSDFTKLSHEEIIFNPQHFLKMLATFDEFCARVDATDPNLRKRQLFWCHLVGFVQRYFPANVAQIWANGSLSEMLEHHAKYSRGFDFKKNHCGSSIFPLSFGSNSGLGYKFGANNVGASTSLSSTSSQGIMRIFQNFSSKHKKFLELVTQAAQASVRKPERSCVIS